MTTPTAPTLAQLQDMIRAFCEANYPCWLRAAVYISLPPDEPDAVLPVSRLAPAPLSPSR